MSSEINYPDVMGSQLPIFVYGTLRSGQPNHWLLRGRTLAEIPATLADMVMISLGDYPAILEYRPAWMTGNHEIDAENIDAENIEGPRLIHGQLLTLHPQLYTDTLRMLDQLEGYHPGDNTSLYWRQMVCVHSAHGHEFAAWAYIGNTNMIDPTGRLVIPHGDWCRYRSDLVRDLKFAHYSLDRQPS